jgi:plasmid stability protein
VAGHIDACEAVAPEWLDNGANTMPNLSIKNVPEHVLTKLRERAVRHHRSVQGELMALIAAAVESPAASAPMPTTDGATRPRRSGSRRIEEIAADHRERWKTPFKQGPLAVDMIRADRDAR